MRLLRRVSPLMAPLLVGPQAMELAAMFRPYVPMWGLYVRRVLEFGRKRDKTVDNG